MNSAIVESALWGNLLQKYVAAPVLADVHPDGSPTSDMSPRALRKAAARKWARHCAHFRMPDNVRAVTQIINTGVPLLVLAAVMFWSVTYTYWLTLLLALPAGALLVRLFIIQHDCGHGSFFSSPLMNTAVGRVMSVFTLAPYGMWRREHAIHHNSSGNLERRGVGDIETLTVSEYLAAPFMERLRYRVYRHPLFLFGFGVPFYFLFLQRLPWFHGLRPSECWRSVLALDAAIAAVYGVLGWFLGFGPVALVMLPILHVAAAIGGWLFFIQHQFDSTVWDEAQDWDFQVAAVFGSSYYVLPTVLQWVTGNIGLHHIHHLNSMVPNYRLQECMDAMPELAQVNRLTLLESLRCVRLTLWDDRHRRLVTYREALMATTAAA